MYCYTTKLSPCSYLNDIKSVSFESSTKFKKNTISKRGRVYNACDLCFVKLKGSNAAHGSI